MVGSSDKIAEKQKVSPNSCSWCLQEKGNPSLPFLLGGMLDASWSSLGSFGSGESSVITNKGKRIQFRAWNRLKEKPWGSWGQSRRVQNMSPWARGLPAHGAPWLCLDVINLWLELPGWLSLWSREPLSHRGRLSLICFKRLPLFSGREEEGFSAALMHGVRLRAGWGLTLSSGAFNEGECLRHKKNTRYCLEVCEWIFLDLLFVMILPWKIVKEAKSLDSSVYKDQESRS